MGTGRPIRGDEQPGCHCSCVETSSGCQNIKSWRYISCKDIMKLYHTAKMVSTPVSAFCRYSKHSRRQISLVSIPNRWVSSIPCPSLVEVRSLPCHVDSPRNHPLHPKAKQTCNCISPARFPVPRTPALCSTNDRNYHDSDNLVPCRVGFRGVVMEKMIVQRSGQ